MAKKGHWINNFPLCALVYKETAEMLGYDEDEAKSMGIVKALSFSVRAKDRKFTLPGRPVVYDILYFAGARMCCVLEDGNIRAFFGGRVAKPGTYDKVVRSKIVNATSAEIYTKLRKYVKSKLSSLKRRDLDSSMTHVVYSDLAEDSKRSGFIEMIMGS